MYKYTLVLALLSVASAQSTTSLLLIGFDQQDIVASIVGSEATATTFAIACGDPDSDECGIPTSFTFTQGPSTIHYDYHVTDDGSDESIDLGCMVTSSDHGICTGSMVGNFDGTSTSTSYRTSFSTGASEYVQYQAVTITAGAAGSSASTAASTTQGSSDAVSATKSASGSAASQTSGMTTATSPGASGTKILGASSSAASSASSPSSASSASGSAVSTAGMAMVTGSPRWVLGGAAAALALAAM
ncbi:hypothetical protein LSUB1_G001156 [Lachnellula subtilissima]|uniref:GPI anchored protein n=1 Tax=Lachnellula subtilissima TaxID=602034 RepID=A0A8H8RXP0_9HELO|nr:hypothetical protein LSUB1_G001156 [Lachnellula subtilissima]